MSMGFIDFSTDTTYAFYHVIRQYVNSIKNELGMPHIFWIASTPLRHILEDIMLHAMHCPLADLLGQNKVSKSSFGIISNLAQL